MRIYIEVNFEINTISQEGTTTLRKTNISIFRTIAIPHAMLW